MHSTNESTRQKARNTTRKTLWLVETTGSLLKSGESEGFSLIIPQIESLLGVSGTVVKNLCTAEGWVDVYEIYESR